ncbi:MAG: hypothetical protein OEN56_05855 [Gemmatimonadota bacterium]|nr:hypothetical protein [Gemmatimonadota bacterium]
MPSEAVMDVATDLSERAVAALEPRIESFRAAVVAAEEEVRTEVVRRVGEESFKTEQALIELGPFAIGRIDPERFASLMGIGDTSLTPDAIDVLDRAERVLKGLGSPSVRHTVDVEPGGDLRDAVKAALARFGRAFGAARAVELARAGAFEPGEHGALLGALPFRLWNRAERRLAPPLVVRTRGEDCVPAGLGEFLDGNVALVLLPEGPTTPAPLARLITPGTFVMQTADPDDLMRLRGTGHPAVALLFDQDRPGQAYFTHDPDGGAVPWDRLSVVRIPSDDDLGRGRRASAGTEELAHLRAMATPATGEADPGPSDEVESLFGDGPDASVDELAAWLLSRTDLGEE